MGLSLQHLMRYEQEVEAFLERIVIVECNMVQLRAAEQATHYAVEARHITTPKKFRNFTTAGKVMLMLFSDSEVYYSATSWREENLLPALDTPKSSVLNCVVPSKTSDLDVCVKVSFCYTTLRDHTQFGTPWTPFETCAESKLKSDLEGCRFATVGDVQQWCHQQSKKTFMIKVSQICVKSGDLEAKDARPDQRR
ncbi:hypothetical protein ANN_03336 [Periplaneta americana]|uniref:Uncharacterized protein n=1 Tax=Periplaneta americana TaxID=6978 RepID=A0ABQ8TYU0_PERAM|nr:hypothetical protein ANN_03336 [Periplaneta americana]